MPASTMLGREIEEMEALDALQKDKLASRARDLLQRARIEACPNVSGRVTSYIQLIQTYAWGDTLGEHSDLQ